MDITRVDLNLLVVLDALLDEQNVTRAARRLGLSQPAVSAALGRLRDAVGDPLFTRVSRGLAPTPRALALAPGVKRVVQDAQDLLKPERFDPAEATGRVAIATTDSVQLTLGIPFLTRLRAEAPRLVLDMHSIGFSDMPARLERGDLDLAITIPEFAPESLQSRSLYRERYVGAARKGHPFLRGKRTPERFCRYDHILVNPRGGTARGPVDDAVEALGLSRRIGLVVSSFLVLPFALAASDLIVTLPESLVAELRQGLSVFELPFALPAIHHKALWHPRVQNDARHRWLREQLVAAAPA